MLSCREISKLVSEALDRDLPWWQRLNLWLHLGMCRLCRGFRRDLVHLHEMTREHARKIEYEAEDASNVTLSEESCAHIKKKLLETQSELL